MQSVFAGSYSAAQDPRLVTEQSRKSATSKVPMAPGTDPFEATVYANIAYNTLLSHIENLAQDPRIKTIAVFKERAAELLNSAAPLPLDPDDVELTRVLNLDHYEPGYERPIISPAAMGMPTYPLEATPIHTSLKGGIVIPNLVQQQVRVQLDIIWQSWREQ